MYIFSVSTTAFHTVYSARRTVAYRVLAVVCALALSFNSIQLTASEQSIADIYTSMAYDFFEKGSLQEAKELAEIALTYNPDNPDALLLYFFSIGRDVISLELLESEMQRAIELGGFRYFRPEDSRIYLSELYMASGQYEKAREVLPFPEDSQLPGRRLIEANVELMYLMRDYSLADRWLYEGIRLFPESDVLADILIQRDPLPGFFTRAYIEYAMQSSPRYLQALLRLAQSQTPVIREEILDQYFSLGGGSADGALIYLENAVLIGQEDTVLDRWNRFKDSGGLLRWDLLRSIENSNLDFPTELIQEISDHLASFSGSLYWYDAFKQFPGQWIEFRDGEIIRWHLDSGSNGRLDYIVHFSDNIPQSIEAFGRMKYENYRYHMYPWVIQYIIHDDKSGERYRYELIPFSLEHRIFSNLFEFERGQLPGKLNLLPDSMGIDSDLSVHIRTREVIQSTGYRQVQEYFRALPVMEYAYNPVGTMIRITEFTDGEPSRSSISMQEDGYFDRVRKYSPGLLTSDAFDLNRDGKADYWLDYSNERAQHIWKLSNDPLLGLRMYPHFDSVPEVDILYLHEIENEIPDLFPVR
ncbi:tetratricopeptide repeat protein [Spirochaeta dissipatitropha]